jgi:hypothetical protein
MWCSVACLFPLIQASRIYSKVMKWSMITSTTTFSSENFMTGLRLVFDRERMILGWKKFNCKYKMHYFLLSS